MAICLCPLDNRWETPISAAERSSTDTESTSIPSGKRSRSDDRRTGCERSKTFVGSFSSSGCDQQDSFDTLRAEQRHHVDFTCMIVLGIEDDQKYPRSRAADSAPRTIFGKNGMVIRHHDAQCSRAIGL